MLGIAKLYFKWTFKEIETNDEIISRAESGRKCGTVYCQLTSNYSGAIHTPQWITGQNQRRRSITITLTPSFRSSSSMYSNIFGREERNVTIDCGQHHQLQPIHRTPTSLKQSHRFNSMTHPLLPRFSLAPIFKLVFAIRCSRFWHWNDLTHVFMNTYAGINC